MMPNWKTPFEAIEIGKGRKLADGDQIAFVTIGHIGNYATEACRRLAQEGIKAGHFDMRFVKPIDEELLHEVFQKYEHIITVEDGCLPGGFGSAVVEFMADHGYSSKVVRLGIPDRVVEHGTQLELHRECGFCPDSLYEKAKSVLEGVPA